MHTPALKAFKPFENFLELYTVACIVSVILQFVKYLFFIPVCKIAFFVHGYIVHIDALFCTVVWSESITVLHYWFIFHLEQPAHVHCNKSAFTSFICL